MYATPSAVYNIVLHVIYVKPLLQMDSRLHADHLEKVMNTAIAGITRVHSILDRTVKEHLQRNMDTSTA